MSAVFVFGSNLAGRHGKGAALDARVKHGARLGVGEGRTGNAYAIPTKDAQLRTRPLEGVRASVETFKRYATANPDLVFQVTRVGCGLAGYTDSQIGPMFSDAPDNCMLPEEWVCFRMSEKDQHGSFTDKIAQGEVIAFTGHRPDKLGGWNLAHPVVGQVKLAIRGSLVDLQPSMVISGMALGVDQWAARESVAIGVPFTAALPCDDMDAAWPPRSRAEFRELLALAARVHVVSPGPYRPWKMQRRNEWMVDNSQRLVTVHDGSSGGTFNCIMYAESVGRLIHPLRWRE